MLTFEGKKIGISKGSKHLVRRILQYTMNSTSHEYFLIFKRKSFLHKINLIYKNNLNLYRLKRKQRLDTSSLAFSFTQIRRRYWT